MREILNGILYERETFMEAVRNPSLFFSTWLGLSSYGGFFGGILGIVRGVGLNPSTPLETLEPLLKYRRDYPTYHLLADAAYEVEDAVRARRYYERFLD